MMLLQSIYLYLLPLKSDFAVNSPPPKPWEQAGSSSGPTPFKPSSPGSTSDVVETSGTARPGEIVSTADRNTTINRNTLGRPVPTRPWEQQPYGSTYGGTYFRSLQYAYYKLMIYILHLVRWESSVLFKLTPLDSIIPVCGLCVTNCTCKTSLKFWHFVHISPDYLVAIFCTSVSGVNSRDIYFVDGESFNNQNGLVFFRFLATSVFELFRL